MKPENSSKHWRSAEALAALAIVIGVGALLVPMVKASADRNRRCVENTAALMGPISSYVQDYDEMYPPAAIWNNPTRFKIEIGSYTSDQSIFHCPATGNSSYKTNAAVAGKSDASFDNEKVVMLEDSLAHPDGKKTVIYLDGHILRGGVEQFVPSADVVCARRIANLGLGLLIYAQDYDEQFPFQTDDAAFRVALYPYLRSNRIWYCPDTGKAYSISQAVRGKTLADFPDPSKVIVFHDVQLHRSGITTTGYLDGHVEQIGPYGIIPDPLGTNNPNTSADQSLRKVKQLSLALLQYSQDYDENLPPLNNMDTLRRVLGPYVANSAIFDPVVAGGAPFILNSALGGTNLGGYQSPSEVGWIKDTNDYGGRLITVGYLDGHAKRVAP